MAAAGVAMMLIEPSQPTQPAPVADTTLITDVQDLIQTQSFLEGVVADVLAIRPQCGLLPASCGAATVVSVENGAIVGIAVSTVGDRTVYAREFKPFEKPTALVTGGPFSLSRNPMYLSMVIVLVGCVVLLGTVWPFLVVPLFIRVITTRFIVHEERMMEDRFGEQYRA